MSKTEQVTKKIQEGLELLGAKVVDVSVYPSTNDKSDVSDILIAAAYFPGKACLFTVKANVYQKDTDTSFTFNIDGECTKQFWNKEVAVVAKNGGYFSDLSRNSGSGESFNSGIGGRTFSINTYVSSSSSKKSINSRLKIGIDFFKDFLRLYGSSLKPRFTHSIFVWYVPEHSDIFEELEKKNGTLNNLNYKPFNSKVLAKFPKGIFAEGQKV